MGTHFKVLDQNCNKSSTKVNSYNIGKILAKVDNNIHGHLFYEQLYQCTDKNNKIPRTFNSHISNTVHPTWLEFEN